MGERSITRGKTLKVRRILWTLIAFAAISSAQPVMTNQTVEAMLRGGVAVPTILTAIKTAEYIQLFMSKEFYDRLINAGASPSVADQIVQAMHDRTYSGAVRPEDVKPAPAAVAVPRPPVVPTAVAQPVETPAAVATPSSPAVAIAIARPPVVPTAVAQPVETSAPAVTPSPQAVALGSGFRTVAQEPLSACPIAVQQIHPHWILGDGDPWGSYLLIQFRNTSSKTIAAVRFGVAFVDALADKHESVYSYDSDSTVKPGKSSHPEWSDGVYAGSPGHKVGAIVWVEKLRFADNTFFVDDGTHSCGAHSR
jgi:hypothetical protein